MKVKIIGDTGLREFPPGRVVDLPTLKAKCLIERGYAIQYDGSRAAAEKR